MQGYNRFWVALKALFRGEERAEETDAPKAPPKNDSRTRDLSPRRDAIGGASKGGLQGDPSKNRPREIDFMGDS